jgi:hypothetical protein
MWAEILQLKEQIDRDRVSHQDGTREARPPITDAATQRKWDRGSDAGLLRMFEDLVFADDEVMVEMMVVDVLVLLFLLKMIVWVMNDDLLVLDFLGRARHGALLQTHEVLVLRVDGPVHKVERNPRGKGQYCHPVVTIH